MTITTLAAAALLAVAGPDLDSSSDAAHAVAAGDEAHIQLAGEYFRRDLGLDPQHSRTYDENGQPTIRRSRGFRIDGAATTPPSGAGVYFLQDPATGRWLVVPNGLRIDTGDPGLLEPG